MNARLPTSFLLGGLVTFALFFMIHKMIAPGDPRDIISVRGVPIDFVRLKRDQELTLKKRALPERPTQPRTPPPLPVSSKTDIPMPRSMPSRMPLVANSGLGIVGPSQLLFPGEDMDVLPLFRVPPQYPIHAERRGLDGWVDLEFSISKIGRVVDPVVLSAKPKGVFDQAARAAIMKWRYRPKIEHGSPVKRTGIRVRITFRLQDE